MGSGKSSLLAAMLGELHVQSGHVTVHVRIVAHAHALQQKTGDRGLQLSALGSVLWKGRFRCSDRLDH